MIYLKKVGNEVTGIAKRNAPLSFGKVIWGENSAKLFIAVHGNMSNKTDAVIVTVAEKLTQLGYQVLNFDLPEHGEHKNKELVISLIYGRKVQERKTTYLLFSTF